MFKKNILIWYWGRNGYTQKYIYQTIKELLKINKKRKSVNLYFSYSKNAEFSKLYEKLAIKKYPIETFENSIQAIIKTSNLFKIRKNFLQFLNEKKIDKIYCPMFHYWNPYFSSIFKKMNIEYVFGIHDHSLHPGENNFLQKKIYELEKKNVNKFVCYSEFIKNKLIKKDKIKKKKLIIIFTRN